MSASLAAVSYLGASLLFILSLGGLASPQTARRGNLLGMVGMGIAIAATLAGPGLGVQALPWVMAAMAGGGVVGWIAARRVRMTQMPELVALMHSLVGLSACLVGITSALDAPALTGDVERMIHAVEIYVGVFIGAVTFSGSLVAFAKLSGRLRGRPVLLPGRHGLNALVLGAVVAVGGCFVAFPADQGGLVALAVMTVLALAFGVHMVLAIGGADMPVVVSMLNSYSGWAASATGFMLSNDLLIVTGALVGSSGAILSAIMCRAMNRNFWHVIAGGFGSAAAPAAAHGGPVGDITAIDVAETATLLAQSRSVVIVPGYGMAVAQAQHAVSEMVAVLRGAGIRVRFAIHPVAGRMPGHMNVLLAEAKVPYDIVCEMDEINDDLPQTDAVVVIGANDIVNPAAQDVPGSPIAGMPVIQVWRAGVCVVLKRSMASGYAGVDNPLFTKDGTRMLFGDAKAVMTEIVTRLRA